MKTNAIIRIIIWSLVIILLVTILGYRTRVQHSA